MSVQEIEKAIAQLRGDELSQLLKWLDEYQSVQSEPAARQLNSGLREKSASNRNISPDEVRELLAGFGQYTGDAFVPESVDMRELAYDRTGD